jgi:hypothetical protein
MQETVSFVQKASCVKGRSASSSATPALLETIFATLNATKRNIASMMETAYLAPKELSARRLFAWTFAYQLILGMAYASQSVIQLSLNLMLETA